MGARIRQTGAQAEPKAGKIHDASIAKDRLVGTGGFEPPTPSVSGKCSTTELRAFVANSGGSSRRNPDPVTNIGWPGNQALAERPRCAHLISSAANGGAEGADKGSRKISAQNNRWIGSESHISSSSAFWP